VVFILTAAIGLAILTIEETMTPPDERAIADETSLKLGVILNLAELVIRSSKVAWTVKVTEPCDDPIVTITLTGLSTTQSQTTDVDAPRDAVDEAVITTGMLGISVHLL